MPLVAPTILIGASFGVTAEPVLGAAATIAMSAIVFAGAAQFAAVAVLAAGGGVLPAVIAGLLMNLRFVPMGLAAGPSMRGGPVARGLQGWVMVDISWAMAARPDGRFDTDFMLGASVPQYVSWSAGTALGVAAGSVLADPQALGLDAIFPAFFLALLWPELRSGPRHRVAAALGALISASLIPLTPAGVPVMLACLAALVGVRR